MGAKVPMLGRVFGRLTVTAASSQSGSWVCLCECGTERSSVAGTNLRNGRSRSCGCLMRENSAAILRRTTQKRAQSLVRHGHAGRGRKTRAYHVWRGMKNRCCNPNNPRFADYGGRGIEVCARWMAFEPFLEDMGEPTPHESIDRIDNDRGYEPGNCRWATTTQQARNTRVSRMLTVQGETLSMADWADRYGVTSAAVSKRMRRGWSVEEAVTGTRTMESA